MLSPVFSAGSITLPILSLCGPAGQGEHDTVAGAIHFDVYARIVAIARGQTIAHIGEADASLARGRRFGIELVFDCETHPFLGPASAHRDLAALDQRRDA